MSVALVALVSAALGFGVGFLAGSPGASNPPGRATFLGERPAEGTPLAATYDALLISDPFARTAALGQILAGLGPDDVESVRTVFASAVTSPADPETTMLAQWWAQHDPQAAFDWAQSARSADSVLVVTAVVRTWAKNDPEAAAAAIRRLGNPGMARPALVALARGWEDGGHADFPRILQDLPQGIEMQLAIETILRRKVLRHGTAEAFRWVESLPPDDKSGGLKTNAMRRVASVAAEFDPDAAMAFAAEHSDSPALLRRVGIALVASNGERAMEWLATLPEGPERKTAVMATYRNWIGSDREAAMRWMRGQEADPWLDPAIHSFAQALSFEEPALGVAWATQISDTRLREDSTWRVSRTWAKNDPAAFQAWFEGSDLPDALKEKIATTVAQDGAPPARATGSGKGAPVDAPDKTDAAGPDA